MSSPGNVRSRVRNSSIVFLFSKRFSKLRRPAYRERDFVIANAKEVRPRRNSTVPGLQCCSQRRKQNSHGSERRFFVRKFTTKTQGTSHDFCPSCSKFSTNSSGIWKKKRSSKEGKLYFGSLCPRGDYAAYQSSKGARKLDIFSGHLGAVLRPLLF